MALYQLHRNDTRRSVTWREATVDVKSDEPATFRSLGEAAALLELMQPPWPAVVAEVDEMGRLVRFVDADEARKAAERYQKRKQKKTDV